MSDLEPNLNLTPQQSNVLKWISVLAVALMIVNWLVVLVLSISTLRELVAQRFPVVVLLPTAGVAAFAVVFLFRQAAGPIELEAFTIKFKGAAGPVFLWILCFLAMALAIKWLW